METDAELDAFRDRVRAHQRKKRMARLVGTAIGLAGLLPAGLAAYLVTDDRVDRLTSYVFLGVWLFFCAAGGFVWQRLEPEQHLDEIE